MMKQLVITTRLTNRETDSFNQYLKDIADIGILTPADEIVLTGKASCGDKDAIDELVRKNLRFVVSVAKQYATAVNPLEDLVNEGNIGLIIAAKKFKPEMGFKFISYAVWWIRKVIMEYLSKNGRMVKLPANKINGLSKLDKKINELEQRLGRRVDIQEIMENYGDELGLTTDVDKQSYFRKITDEFEFLGILNGSCMDSLDRNIDDNDSPSTTTMLSDTISDETIFKATDNKLIEDSLKRDIRVVLDTLKPRDRFIMVALYGLDGNIPRTLKDIGDELGVTREMIRQIREKNLTKLKKKLENTSLKNF